MIETSLEIQTPRVFKPLLKPSRFKGVYGGRGSGKSHFFAELLIEKALTSEKFRAICIREVQKTLKESSKLLIEDKIRKLGVQEYFEILDKEIRTKNGGLIIFRGMNEFNADSIKSLEGFDVAWWEEAQGAKERSLELLRPTIRKSGSELWFSWNPRHKEDAVEKLFRSIEPLENSIIVKANFSDNPFFPNELEAERQQDLKTNRDRYAHIWLGDYEPTVKGAIFNRENIYSNTISEIPQLERIVVAVDPAISATTGSNEHGIIVAGLDSSKKAYILEDGTTTGSPQKWAERAIALYDKYSADAIVVERNQGGDMVKHTLNGVRAGLKIIEVTATRGKHVRAEPISAQYSLGQVKHCGTFPELEDQLCKITAAGYEGEGSPDRADALVWALTELLPLMAPRIERKYSLNHIRRAIV